MTNYLIKLLTTIRNYSNKMENQTVSVIIPCYNMCEYVLETIESVLLQTYKDFEIIIVNDGSTDATQEILESISNPKIKIIHTINQGLANARNTAISNSSGKYILPLDADDKISKRYLELACAAFQSNPNLNLVYGRAEYFGDQKEEWNLEKFDLKKLLMYNQIYASAVFKREDYNKTKGYDSQMKFGWEDWEFWISLLGSHIDPQVHYITQEIVFYYRVRNNSMIRVLSKNQRDFLLQVIYCKHAQLYNNLFINPFELYYENQYYKKIINNPVIGKIVKVFLKLKLVN
jgi:glycosyltransferase involved in cell wall biosynthesis